MDGDVGRAGTEWVRRRNTAAVLRALRSGGAASRAELAHRTGLAKATVGTIVASLEAGGALAEEPSRGGLRGRPARPVALAGDRYVALGLELNVDYVAAVVLDLAGSVLRHETRPVDPDGPLAALSALATATARRIAEDADRELVGAVVAVPGLVRADDRTVAWAPNVDIDGERVATEVERALGEVCPVHVSNDADCAAYAEAHHGAATDTRSLLYLTGTVGVGAGIVEAGTLVRGAGGFAGEVGHMPVGDSTALCGCGRRGCWEASVGLHAMLAAVGMPELDTPLLTAASVADRARTDDSVRAGLERVGRDVGLGIAMLSSVLDPEVIVLGGYFAALGDLVLTPARRTLDERLASDVQVRPDVRPSTLGIQAAALGAAEQSFGPVLTGELDLTA